MREQIALQLIKKFIPLVNDFGGKGRSIVTLIPDEEMAEYTLPL